MKKRLLLLLTLTFILTGCSIPQDGEGSTILIYLSTTFQEMTNEGFLNALLVYPIAQAINFLGQYMSIFWAIALVSIFINVVVLALTFKSNVSNQKMQTLQPQLQKITEKYQGKDDPISKQKMAQEQMALYKENDIKIGGTILALIIPMPILFAVWAAVKRSALVASSTFFGVALSITPLQGFMSLNWVIISIFIINIILQYISISIPQWLAEKKAKELALKQHKPYHKAKNPMKMMMYVMPGVMALILFNLESAVGLYYIIYSLVTIGKTFLIDYITRKKDNKVEVVG